MSRFTGKLMVTSLDSDCIVWRTEQNIVYEVGSLGSGRYIHVKSGFETDGASIPPFLRGFLPSFGRYTRAAVIHDYLCDRFHSGDAHEEGMELKSIDAIFYEAMLVCGVNRNLAWVLWAGVRLGRMIPFLNSMGSSRPTKLEE